MRLLREEGAHVVFLPANREHAGTYTDTLQSSGIEVWHAPFAKRAPAWLREHGPRFDSVIACRHYVAREFLPLLRRHEPQARVVFDTVRSAEHTSEIPSLMRISYDVFSLKN